MEKLLGVVAGIRRGDRWLLIRRSAGVARAPLKVCFPGGGVESGEEPAQALVREMREELAITIRPARHCWTWNSPDGLLTLLGYHASIESGTPQANPSEVAQILWLTDQEILALADGMATNALFLAALADEPSI